MPRIDWIHYGHIVEQEFEKEDHLQTMDECKEWTSRYPRAVGMWIEEGEVKYIFFRGTMFVPNGKMVLWHPACFSMDDHGYPQEDEG